MVGIVTTGAVAITAQAFAYRREAATRRHVERLQFDAEARTTLDSALATAYEGIAALDSYASALGRLSVHDSGSLAQVEAAEAAANDAAAELRLDASRLIVRFGPEDIVYARYASALLAYFDHLTQNTNFRSNLELESADREADNGPADTRHLQRLVFEFAAHAHEWATDVRS